jgi:hypothetical protein
MCTMGQDIKRCQECGSDQLDPVSGMMPVYIAGIPKNGALSPYPALKCVDCGRMYGEAAERERIHSRCEAPTIRPGRAHKRTEGPLDRLYNALLNEP